MTTKATKLSVPVSQLKSEANARLARLRKSARYESFYVSGAVEEFYRVESSAYAGKPTKQRKARAS